MVNMLVRDQKNPKKQKKQDKTKRYKQEGYVKTKVETELGLP
jgi:hypothetical protein